jgi:hypothetical protein
MAGADEVISQLQNISVQLAAANQFSANATPAATTTASPKFTGVSLGTAAITVLISTSVIRHGIMFHNPGGTATCYVFQTGMANAPTTSVLAGALAIAPGSSVMWPSSQFPNINVGFSGFAGTGTAAPFTVIEFF